jgi:hypothetical protein
MIEPCPGQHATAHPGGAARGTSRFAGKGMINAGTQIAAARRTLAARGRARPGTVPVSVGPAHGPAPGRVSPTDPSTPASSRFWPGRRSAVGQVSPDRIRTWRHETTCRAVRSRSPRSDPGVRRPRPGNGPTDLACTRLLGAKTGRSAATARCHGRLDRHRTAREHPRWGDPREKPRDACRHDRGRCGRPPRDHPAIAGSAIRDALMGHRGRSGTSAPKRRTSSRAAARPPMRPDGVTGVATPRPPTARRAPGWFDPRGASRATRRLAPVGDERRAAAAPLAWRRPTG